MPWLPQEMRPDTAEGWQELGRELGEIGARLLEARMNLAYHNHDFEMVEIDGRLALDWLLEDIEPGYLALQLDVAWIERGGQDPAALIARYDAEGHDIISIHAKDVAPQGEAQDEGGWADVGQGIVNWQQVLPAAREAGKLYAVIQNRRYNREIRRLQHFLSTGVIGNVTTIHSDFFIGAHFGGFRDRMKHVLLKDMAIHTFDAARFLSGQDPRAVYCHEWNPTGSWYDHGASAIAIFELSNDNDIVFSYRGSWAAEGFRTSWDSEWRIIGERGSVFWDGAQRLACQLVDDASSFLASYRDLDIPSSDFAMMLEGHAGVIQAFAHALKTGTEPETVGSDNIKSLVMVFGAVESAETGKRVELSPMKG